jgi:tetratricopeptide (TPR) repeat protein
VGPFLLPKNDTGNKKEAEESLRAALARLEKLHEPEFEVQKFGELLEVRQLLGSLLVEQRRLPEARALLTEALAQISNKPAQVSNEIAQLRLDLADLERKEGHPAKALPIIDSAISDLTHLAEIESGAKSTPAILRLGNALMVRARLAEEAGDRKIARSSLDLALSKADKLLVAAPALPEALILRAVGLTARADLMRDENTPMARADMELASTALEGCMYHGYPKFSPPRRSLKMPYSCKSFQAPSCSFLLYSRAASTEPFSAPMTKAGRPGRMCLGI